MDKNSALAYKWVKESASFDVEENHYCPTRDVFQARLDSMVNLLLNKSEIAENDIYILSAVAGEIGNNSFDHNLGNWPDVPGVFFTYEFNDKNLTIVLADRGQGILKTLRRVKPELNNDKDALLTAFNEKLSGRAPESRGNGLKFVKGSIKQTKNHLTFMSGTATAELNNEMIIKTADKINGCLAIISN